MSGRAMFGGPQRIRRGATLTIVFGAVLVTGAATGSFDRAAGETTTGAERTAGAPVDPVLAGESSPAAAPVPVPVSAGSGGPAPDAASTAGAGGREAAGPSDAARLVGRDGGRWSAAYTRQQYESFRQELGDRYVGVGVWVRRAPDGRITVSHVQSPGPAGRAGLKVGDTLVAVDGTRVSDTPVTDVVSRLRGVDPADPADPATAPAPKVGSTVRLAVRRDGHDWAVTVRREMLPAGAVTVTRPAPEVTAIAVDSFVGGVGDQVRAALAAGDHRDGVLLDLRGDSGGLVTEAVDVASLFLDGGPVATYDVDGRPCALYARAGGDTATPLVVLVDGGTMSAAELLTGALQDRGRAIVVGSRTFGKGSVQMPSTLPDGSVAELTVGHYLTPSGHVVDGRGVRPDLSVAPGTDPHGVVDAALTVLSGLGAPT